MEAAEKRKLFSSFAYGIQTPGGWKLNTASRFLFYLRVKVVFSFGCRADSLVVISIGKFLFFNEGSSDGFPFLFNGFSNVG